ncbi:MAG TPA: hypothetical protein VK175_19870 [Leadbetterella sp.]|nr:hypothetical protein [Leadbetterella sp.]
MKYTITLILIFCRYTFSYSQSVTISPGNTQAGIISNSVNNGILPPRMNYTQILAIASPVEGTMVYDTEFKCLRVYNGSKWICLNDRLPGPNDIQGNFIGLEYGNTLPDHLYYNNHGSEPIDIKVDITGSIYVVFSNFNKDPLESGDGTRSRTIFLQKYNSSFQIIWSKTLGTLNLLDFNSFRIKMNLDSNNNIYITGYDNGKILFGDGSTNNVGMFLVKYNSDGDFIFKKISSGDVCKGLDIKVDANGDIYVAGEYSGTTIFQNSPYFSLASLAGSKDAFVAKYNSLGEIVWVASMGGSGEDYAAKLSVSGSSLVVAGYFTSTALFGNSISKTSLGGRDIFISKFSTTGSFLWVNTLGGNGSENLADLNLRNNGDIDLFGDINGILTYYPNPSSNTSTSLSISANVDLFFMKYFSNGNIQYGSPILIGGSDNESAGAMVMNGSEDLYFTGLAGNNFSYRGHLLSSGAFMMKLGVTESWAIGGPSEKGVVMALNAQGQVFVSGSISSSKTYFVGNYLTPATDKCYLWKYSE